ncbi:MAG: TonB-dependent receptor [Flavobacteriaceae bacterium]
MEQNFTKQNRLSAFCAIFVLTILFGVPSLYAQSTVTGSVSDANGPLPGASIVVKGTTTGTQSDFDGNYSIEVPSGANTLIFSYIGYSAQEIAIDGRSSISVQLEEDAQALSEVVVVGYGTQRKADLTGSVGSVGAADIITKPITSPDQVLAGTIAGVNITNRSGDPGAPISVLIRGVGTPGVNDPLWVIDGVPIVQTTNITVNTSSTTDSNPLAGLNANDIESIDVLKDAASTAIYGARAANGVIIVTTKRGKTGDARVTYDMFTSWAGTRDRIDVLGVDQYVDIQGELGTDVSQFRGQPFVDWQDLIFKTGFVQSHNVSVGGGSDKATYFISGSYFDQEGIELAQGFSRYSFKANSDIKAGKRLKFGQSLLISQTDRQVQSEPGIFAGFNSSLNAPYYQPFGDGAFGYNDINPTTVGNGSATNYLFNTDDRYTFTTIQNRKVLGNFYGELEIIEGLKLRPSLGLDYNVGVGEYFTSDAVLNNSTGASLLVSSRPIELTLTSAATLQYDKTFGDGDHNIGALFGFEQTKFRFDKVRLQGRDLFNTNFAASGTTVAGANEADLWTLQGWLGRLTYNFQGKYLATFNVRRDATSRFAEGNRDQVFPSVSVGWRISDEAFFNKGENIDDIKIRAGWGQSGNQFTGLNYAYLSAIDNNIRYVIGDGQGTVVAPAPTTFANADLKWETSDQFDIGVDASFLKGKLTTTFDYYNKTTNDVLLGFPLPYVSGFFLAADANIGQIKNSGIEFSFNWNDNIGDLKYSFGANITTVKNEVTDLGPIPQIVSGIGGASTHRTIVGESLGHFYGYKTDGLYQNAAEVAAALPDANGTPSPGDIRFVDVNGDGQVNAEDRTILGSPFPGFFYGMVFNAEYKGLDFSVNFRGVGDRQIYNAARQPLEGMLGQNNFSTQVLNRWTGEGTTNSSSNPRLAPGDPNGNTRYSDRWIENAGYLRIQNISVGYSLPQDLLRSWTDDFVSNVRVYVGAQNLATFTKYSGYDPEVGRTQSFQKGEFTLATGQDGGASPLPRIIQLGLSVSFN